MVAESGKLPVPNFAAGGVATPADASLMMQLGAEAVLSAPAYLSRAIRSSEPKPSSGDDALRGSRRANSRVGR